MDSRVKVIEMNIEGEEKRFERMGRCLSSSTSMTSVTRDLLGEVDTRLIK